MRLTLSETLILLVLVSVAIAICVDLAAPVRPADEETAWRLRRIARAIERFREDQGRPPVRLDELLDAWRTPGGSLVTYLDRVPVDVWGRPFRYRAPGTDGRAFDLWSLGADGREGGEGLDADTCVD